MAKKVSSEFGTPREGVRSGPLEPKQR